MIEQSVSLPYIFFSKLARLFSNRRQFIILLLGFSSGLPLLLTGSTLQAWYTVSNVDIVTIGILSLVGQPYVYKFLWAPLLDRYILPFGGKRKGWILFFQFTSVIVLVLMAFQNPGVNPLPLGFLALFCAFLSASQDIAIDAYRIDLLKPKEWGWGVALNTMGYRIAMLVAGALALVIADEIGWKLTYFIMSGLMAGLFLITLFAPSPSEVEISQTLTHAIVNPFKEFLSRKTAWVILLFIIIYKLGDVFTLTLGTTFLIRGVGFSLTDVGLIYKVMGMAGTFLGVFIGGIFLPRLGMYRALMYFGFVQAITNLPFLALAIVGKQYILLIITIFIESLGSGLGSVAFVSYIMSLCDHRYTATQFALFSALAAVGRVFAGPISGVMVEHLGWIHFYFWAFIFGLPGLVLLWMLKSTIKFAEEKNLN